MRVFVITFWMRFFAFIRVFAVGPFFIKNPTKLKGWCPFTQTCRKKGENNEVLCDTSNYVFAANLSTVFNYPKKKKKI